MSDPLVEDFIDIRVRLEMIEREKLKALAAPDVQPNWAPAAGYLADYTDFDPA